MNSHGDMNAIIRRAAGRGMQNMAYNNVISRSAAGALIPEDVSAEILQKRPAAIGSHASGAALAEHAPPGSACR